MIIQEETGLAKDREYWMDVNIWKSYIWTADKDVNMKAVIYNTSLNFFQALFPLLLR